VPCQPEGDGGLGGFGIGRTKPCRGRDTESRQRVHRRRVTTPERRRRRRTEDKTRSLGGEAQKQKESRPTFAAGQQQGGTVAPGRGQFVGRGQRRRSSKGQTENAKENQDSDTGHHQQCRH